MDRKFVICLVLLLVGIASFNFTYSLATQTPEAQNTNNTTTELKPNPVQEEVKIMDAIDIGPVSNDNIKDEEQSIIEEGFVSEIEEAVQEKYN